MFDCGLFWFDVQPRMDEMEDVSSSVRPLALPIPEPLEMADAHSLIAISDCKTPLKAASIPFCVSVRSIFILHD